VDITLTSQSADQRDLPPLRSYTGRSVLLFKGQ